MGQMDMCLQPGPRNLSHSSQESPAHHLSVLVEMMGFADYSPGETHYQLRFQPYKRSQVDSAGSSGQASVSLADSTEWYSTTLPRFCDLSSYFLSWAVLSVCSKGANACHSVLYSAALGSHHSRHLSCFLLFFPRLLSHGTYGTRWRDST